MSGLLHFHRIAAERGDGLHPTLVALLEQRQAIAGGDPKVTELASHRVDNLVQAGPGPQAKLPDFRPGNVVDFRDKASQAAAGRKTSNGR